MSNVGAIANTVVVVPVQFENPLTFVFWIVFPSSMTMALGAVAQVNVVFDPSTVPDNGCWNPDPLPPISCAKSLWVTGSAHTTTGVTPSADETAKRVGTEFWSLEALAKAVF